MVEGARVWLIPDGFLPQESSGALESHEAICILNTSLEEAQVQVSVYFENREPITGIDVFVPAERTRHVHLERPEQVGGATIPRGVPYALRLESNVPVTVQHSRMDTSQEALTLMTTMAYAGG